MKDLRPLTAEVIAVALGHLPEPPVDLIQVAEDLNVCDIRSTSFRDGFTDFAQDSPVIYLNRAESGPRMRLVFAHELAHVMLRKPAVMRLIEMRGRSYLLRGEENLANDIAATLLIPEDLVKSIRESNLTIDNLERLATYAQVTPRTLVTRLAEARVDTGFLHWKRGVRSWHVIDRPGAPESLHESIILSKVGAMVFEGLNQRESPIIVDCRVGEVNAKIHGTGRRIGEHVIQLIRPSRDIRIVSSEVRIRSVIDSWRPIAARAC